MARPRPDRAVVRERRLLPPAVRRGRDRAAARGSSRPAGRAGWSSRPTGSATSWAGGGPDGVTGPGVLTGSHLDSVLDGGAYDGPLGVVSALAAIDLLRDRGFVPAKPIGVSVFAEEEGSRFGLACLGSRLAAGAMSWEKARELRDRDGVFLPDALDASGLAVTDGDKAWGLGDRVECFVELHVEQGRDLVDRGAAVGVASEIWPHGRYRFDFAGEANHAGTTRMEDRRDPMLTYAMTALAANKQARLAGERATFGRVEVDAERDQRRAVAGDRLAGRAVRDRRRPGRAGRGDLAAGRPSARGGTARRSTVTAESVSGAVAFDPGLARRIAADHEDGDWPIIPTMAGHDAGILSAAGIPTAMLFVRNPTGVSHSPAEHAEMADCLVGVSALADTLERLARPRERDVPAGAGVGGRRRARRRAGGDRRRTVHFRHTSSAFPHFQGVAPARTSGIPGQPGIPTRPHPRPHPPRAGELPQPRVPPGAAGADPAGAGDVLDLARPDVRRGGDARPGLLLRAGAGDVPRDGRRRDHDRRGVPLPPPPARRDAVRRPERDGARADRGRPRGRDPDRAARHLLPVQRVRGTCHRGAIALLRRVRRRLGCQNGAIAPE